MGGVGVDVHKASGVDVTGLGVMVMVAGMVDVLVGVNVRVQVGKKRVAVGCVCVAVTVGAAGNLLQDVSRPKSIRTTRTFLILLLY